MWFVPRAASAFRELAFVRVIRRRHRDFGEGESRGSGLRGLKANPVCFLASVAQASADWAGQAYDSLKFDPVG